MRGEVDGEKEARGERGRVEFVKERDDEGKQVTDDSRTTACLPHNSCNYKKFYFSGS